MAFPFFYRIKLILTMDRNFFREWILKVLIRIRIIFIKIISPQKKFILKFKLLIPKFKNFIIGNSTIGIIAFLITIGSAKEIIAQVSCVLIIVLDIRSIPLI